MLKIEHGQSVNHTVGVIGARGYVGAEIIRLIVNHPRLILSFASSRRLAGKPIAGNVTEANTDLRFINVQPAHLHQYPTADVYILALPNCLTNEYVTAIEEPISRGALIIDMSADHRFHDSWTYGLPELDSQNTLCATNRIANPGCYATAAQLVIHPLLDRLATPPCAFGVSGYSGAGTTTSPKNDPDHLRENLIPYKMTDHLHEREISHHLNQAVRFAPHVASFFRGISMTVMMILTNPVSFDDLVSIYESAYEHSPFIQLTGSTIPLVRDNAEKHHACIGGLTVSKIDPRQITVVSTLDNLLKGAASQAVQNVNLALGLDEREGLAP